jgi:DNA polymerase V
MTNPHTLTQVIEVAANNPPYSEILLICHRISAGFPSPAADHADDELDLNEYLISNKSSTYMFTVKGDSMSGAGIENGDKVVVDRSLSPAHDDIVVAIVNGEFTIKRLFKRRGKIELHAENPAYAPITFAEGAELQVWGVVTGVVRRYTKKPRG